MEGIAAAGVFLALASIVILLAIGVSILAAIYKQLLAMAEVFNAIRYGGKNRLHKLGEIADSISRFEAAAKHPRPADSK